VRPHRIGEAWWVCAGALLLFLLQLISPLQIAHALYEGLDVYLFLAGMMILAEIARAEKVFDWAASVAATHARNSPQRLFTLVYGVGVAVTALLSNDATAVVMTPAVLAVVRRARVSPKPYLLACALIANAASFVLPISNPANLVVFGRDLPPLSDWVRIFLAPSAAAIAVTFICLRWPGRHALAGRIEGQLLPMPLTTEGKLALTGLLLAAGALIGSSALGFALGAATCGAALLVLAAVAGFNRRIVAHVARGVSWSILPLVAGLFVLVEALGNAGLSGVGQAGLQGLSRMPQGLAKCVAALSAALASNAMNNLPVGLMSGAAIRHAHESGTIAHALLLGVDLGPNLSVTGSLATILWLIVLRRENIEISAAEFFTIGLLAMPAALLASLLVLWS
jgi:arsenical pump membrane protein